MSEGGITAWNICPVFKGKPFFKVILLFAVSSYQKSVVRMAHDIYSTAGIGYGTTIICFVLNIYYIVILAWGAHYFYNSFAQELPWATCGHYWNTERCFTNTSLAQNGTVDPVVEYWE